MTSDKTQRASRKVGWKELLLTLFLIVVVWGAQELLGIDLLDMLEEDPATHPEGIEVFFTTPRYPDTEDDHYGGLDETLAEAIGAATRTVDIAAYDFDLARVADALVRVHEAGVTVRLVTDTDYEDELGPRTLRKAGIPIVTDDRDPFMHNKFVVIDGEEVWTGSWNLTDNGTYRNNNNALRIFSRDLAANYTAEFEEMFEDKAFGTTSPDNTQTVLTVGGISVQNFFSSEGNVPAQLLPLLENAQSSIRFMAFVFTDTDLAKALRAKGREGVLVEGVVEARNVSASGSDVEALRDAGIEVLADGNPYVMHHKVIIIDEAIVITGSYNFSRSAAESNDENLLILYSEDIARLYLEEFQRVYQAAKEAEEAE